MSNKPFRVIIVGGGISGLTLANALERFDIDYVVLEAYKEIAPQVGASIGLMPNGLRILDQLGCYDELREIVGREYIKAGTRGSDGKLLPSEAGALNHVERMLGYPSFFLDRQMLLRVLHEKLKHKDRVLTNQRVIRISLKKNGVEVVTKDGNTFEGDIVVGADGIHSAVRQEMWRIGGEQCPGYFPDDEASRVSVDTRCIFGISKRPDKWPPYTQANVFGKKNSFLIVPAPGDRVYWFLFASVGPTQRGKGISRYTKEDERLLANVHRNDPVHDNGAVFGDLYDARLISTLVPLEEHVFAKWHFKRIITIGDASHKVDPISGQGGNGAIEAVALLINSLNRLITRHPGNTGITEAEIDEALGDVHARRFERAKAIVKQGHTLQQIATQQMWGAGIVIKVANQLLGRDLILGKMVGLSAPAPHIERLMVPRKTRAMPFDDELPAKPLSDTWAPSLVKWFTVGSLGALTYLSRKSSLLHHGWLQRGLGNAALVAPMSTSETMLRSAANMIPTLVLWIIEGYRHNNSVSLAKWPSIFLAAATSNVCSPGTASSMYYLGSVLTSTNSVYGRSVAPNAARAVAPAVLLGYVLPTALSLLPVGDKQTRQGLLAVWHIAPLLSTALAKGFTVARSWLSRRRRAAESSVLRSKLTERQLEAKQVEEILRMYDKVEVPALYSAYALACGTSALIHVGCSLKSVRQPGDWMAASLRGSDIISSASMQLYLLHTIWDMRVLGYISTAQACKVALSAIVGQAVLGPAAAYAGVWWWRETVFSDLAE